MTDIVLTSHFLERLEERSCISAGLLLDALKDMSVCAAEHPGRDVLARVYNKKGKPIAKLVGLYKAGRFYAKTVMPVEFKHNTSRIANQVSERRTGRTTRMLEQARTLAEQGRAVYVIADGPAQAQAFALELADKPGISIEVGAPRTFDWMRMELRGAWPNCVVLVDHHAIEQRFAAMLAELHRYDSEAEA